jgi:hypothetical protein
MANPHPHRARWRISFRRKASSLSSKGIMINGRSLRVERTSVLGKRKRLIRLPEAISGRDLYAISTVLAAVGGRWSSWRKGFVFDSDPTAAIIQFTADVPLAPPRALSHLDYLARGAVAGYTGIPITTAPLRVLVPEVDDGALVRAVLDLGGEHIKLTTTAPKHHLLSTMPTDPRLRVYPGTLTALLETRPAPFDAVLMLAKQGTSSTDLVRQLWEHVVPGGRLTVLLLDVAEAERRELYAMAARYGAHRTLRSEGGSTSLRAAVVWMVRPGGRSVRVPSGHNGNRG